MNEQNAKQEPPKLLPCPFCGNPHPSKVVGRAYCECQHCNTKGPMMTDSAVKDWNRRITPATDAPTAGEAGDIVARVLELDSKATPGPWISKGYGFGRGPSIGEVGFTHGFQDDCDGSENGENDAELIAFYRTACPQLARTIATLRDECEGLRGLLEAKDDEIARITGLIGTVLMERNILIDYHGKSREQTAVNALWSIVQAVHKPA